MKQAHFWKNLFKIITPLLLGIGTSLIIKDDIYKYESFIKPAFAPPKIVFPIAWSVLYLLIGLSYYFVTKNKMQDQSLYNSYVINLSLNYLWPIVFFSFKNLFITIFILIFLIISAIYLFRVFYKQNSKASFLIIPYILWLFFALYLNVSIYILNI